MPDAMHRVLSGGLTVDGSGRAVDTLSLGVRRHNADGKSPWIVANLGAAKSGTPAAIARDAIYGAIDRYIKIVDPQPPAVLASPAKLAAPKPAPVASASWPLWAKAVAAFRAPGDVGVGDTVQRMLGAGGQAFKLMMTTLGAPCGCDERRDAWNGAYRYPKA